MSRRSFLQQLWRALQGALLAGMAPAAVAVAAQAAGAGGPPLPHYRPLNGRSLRELARRRLHHGEDRFLNPLGIDRRGRLWQVLSWKLFHRNRFREYFDGEQVAASEPDWAAIAAHRGVSVTFLKHAGLLIKDRGTHLLVDPVFSDIFWFIQDFTPLDTAGMPAPDHVLITHGHYDHLDTATLAGLPAGTPLITPLGYGDIFEALKMNRRTQLDWFDTCRAGGAEITLLPCNHWTMRNPLAGPNRSLWGSYLVRTAGGMTIYLSGDTAYFDGFEQIGADYDIDLAIFNLGAYEPRWFMAPSHIDPAETVRAFGELGAEKLMIVHWGTFRLGDEPVHFPPRDIARQMAAAGRADRLLPVLHGQTLFYDA